MRAVLGPFHPHLEDALVGEILTYKRSDPLCPLLIVVPSDSLRRRLKVLLARDCQLNLLNLHILTFHQLSLRLLEESQGATPFILSGDTFLEEVLRQTLYLGDLATAAFTGIEERAGGCAALWQTLRDLKDGMVEPLRALEALAEGHFGQDGASGLANLFQLFQSLLAHCKDWEVRDYSDLAIEATRHIPASRFLEQFRQIVYYGFYDLTQAHLEFLGSVARHYPTTLFFPLVHLRPSHPAWVFAERFYERYLHGLAGDSSGIRNLVAALEQRQNSLPPSLLPLFTDEPEGRDSPSPTNLRCMIYSCFGGRDELATAAKEILRLVSDEKISFNEIGVVARSLDPYLAGIKEIFFGHRIPMTTTAEERLVQFPLAKAVLLFITLPSKDYLRSHFIDLVSSPFLKIHSFRLEGFSPRPDLWDLLTRRLGISKGIEEWRRLERHLSKGLILSEGADEGDPRMITIAAGQVRTLWNLFTELYQDLNALPKEASWTQYVSAWKTLLEKYLAIGDPEKNNSGSLEEQVIEVILSTLEDLAGLDAIHPKVSLDHFIQTYHRWLERSSIPLMDGSPEGVTVADAMTARGLPFRALFVLGLNEGIFPRTIREDAFLRDRERRTLETVLGYKVSEKLAAFDEEKLLFTLLVGAARERLYCLYQRSDEDGRALAPSWYLEELRRALRGQANGSLTETTIPRGIAEKKDVAPFSRNDLLLPEELAIRLTLQASDPSPLVKACSLAPSLYVRGRRVAHQLEIAGSNLAEFDGMVGPLSDYWNQLEGQGFSPTLLETYARCPFQFFARHILELERLKRPEAIVSPPLSEQGELGHLILSLFYQELMDRGYFEKERSSLDFQMILKATVQRAFAEYESRNPVGYPVAWEVLQEALTELLSQVIARDLEALSQSGYRPIALETEAAGQLEEIWPDPLKGLPIHGRIDRIDHQPRQNSYRVIDYKFKSGRSPSSEDKDLYLSALTGKRLQPPCYLLLGKKFAARQESKSPEPTVEAVFYYLAPRWPSGPLITAEFSQDGWEGKLGRGLKETLSFLIKGIQQGRFFIQPGDYCRYCEVSEICRKNHLPTQWRVENDPVTIPHRELRKKKAQGL